MAQIITNILILAARYVLSALGISVVYRFSGNLDFAQGALYILGAYCCFIFASMLSIPLWLSILLGAVMASCLGGLINWGIYRPIRRVGNSNLAILLASLGLLMTVENFMALIFGEASLNLPLGDPHPGLLILGARITSSQLVLIGSAIVICFAVWLLLNHTHLGLMLRALGSNHILVTTVGISSVRLSLKGAVCGAFLSGLAGGLIVLETDITPMIGTDALLVGILVTLLGGPGRMGGAAVAAASIAVLEGLAGNYISLLWREAIAFALVLAVICLRSEAMIMKRGGASS